MCEGRGHGGSLVLKSILVRPISVVSTSGVKPAPPTGSPIKSTAGSTTILIVDDEASILEITSRFLEREGFSTLCASDGQTGLRLAREAQPDLVVLDAMLPRLDGWAVLETLREESRVPVLMLTAMGEESDRLRGLNSGADDYLIKPFSPLELVARVRAILRRGPPVGEHLRIGSLEIDLDSQAVRLAGLGCDLTPVEYHLLILLARHQGRIFGREELLERVWGADYPGVIRVVDVHVSSLRRKLGDEVARSLIQTVHRRGYRLGEA